jgi:hypothetical protein
LTEEYAFASLQLLIIAMGKELRLKLSKHLNSNNMLMFLVLSLKMLLQDFSLMRLIIQLL